MCDAFISYLQVHPTLSVKKKMDEKVYEIFAFNVRAFDIWMRKFMKSLHLM